MGLSPLWQAGPWVASHALAAIAAMVLGAVQLALAKGTRAHRMLGYYWVITMAYVAASSFMIHEFRILGPFSPIHVLSAITLVSLWRAISFARAGRMEAHRRTMVALYALALVVTGIFTLLPGRTMHEVLVLGAPAGG